MNLSDLFPIIKPAVQTVLDAKAPLESPALTGTPSAPTAAPGAHTTQIATTAFVAAAVDVKAPLENPVFTGVPSAPTAAPETNTTQLATTAFVTAALALGGGGSGLVAYQLKTAAFTAVAMQTYAVDTSNGVITITLPEAPTTGQFIQFADARGTWNTNAVTFTGGKIEGEMVDYMDSAQGTALALLYIDATTGWRILESGTKPHVLVGPAITGNTVGLAITSTTGLWTGSPNRFIYQWQVSDDGANDWTNISGATSATFVPTSDQIGKYVRLVEIAENANGSSLPAESNASAAIIVPAFPVGAVAYWKLDETSGTRVDATGNGNDLTDVNGVGSDVGLIGNAAAFISGAGAVLTGIISSTAFTGMTIAGWVNASTGYQFFSNYAGDNNLEATMLQFYGGDGNAIQFQAKTGASAHGIIQDTVNTVGAWTFVCARWDGTTWTLRVNDRVLNDTITSSVAPDFSLLGIGAPPDTSQPYGITGLTDELGVWPRAISDAEADVLYNGGAGTTYPV